MKILSKIFLLFLSLQAFCQKTDAITVDSTGGVYVIFLRNDSTGVVYKGKHTTFTTDYIFAKDLAAFDLQFKGFSRFKIKATDDVHDCIVNISKDTSEVIDPILPTIPPSEINIFPNPPNYQKNAYFVEPYTWEKVKYDKSKIVGMNGFDFAPIAAEQKSLYEYGDWIQEYHATKGRDIWTDDGAYFLKPKGYFTDLSTNLMDFDLRFPDFTTPKGKIVVMQPTPTREIDTYNYLKKGVTYVKGRMDQKGYSFVSDAWLMDLGCPPAYGVSQEVFDKWCEQVDGDRLLQSFISNVYYPNKDVGYCMLNWEHVGHRWNVRKDKIIRCLEYWKNNPHTAKMALWTVSSVSMGKPVFQGYGLDFSEILTFNGSYDELRNKYGTYVSVDDSYAKYVEIAQIGGYMNYPIDDGLIYHYLFELLLNKKYTDKQVLWTFWFDQEFVGNFNLGWLRVDSKDGSYLAQVKPKVFPSVAFNVGVWSMVGDGLDCWSDPNYWTEKKEFWGWGAKDLSGNELPNKFDEHNSKYPSQPMKAVDWMMSGVWAMSENKDIVEAKSDWQFVTLPTKSYHEKTVLIAYKIKGNEALVLAYDGFCDADTQKVHSFSINNKTYSVKTYGRYTSVVRLNL